MIVDPTVVKRSVSGVSFALYNLSRNRSDFRLERNLIQALLSDGLLLGCDCLVVFIEVVETGIMLLLFVFAGQDL